MENKSFVSIQEAAGVMGKSVQTIRRLIKKGEIKAKRVKTPQGFNYIIELSDLAKNAETSEFVMLDNSPIQNEPVQHAQAKIEPAPIQHEILTNQTPVKAHVDTDYYLLDIQKPEMSQNNNKQLLKLLEDSHREKMFLMTLIQKLQEELKTEREKEK